MTFDYLTRVVVDAQLEIENIGDCVLQCRNDFAEEFYLIIKTELGWTEILEYGPCVPDLDLLPYNYQIKYSRIEYNQGRIEKTIDKFLNDPKKSITQANVCQLAEIREFLVNPIDRLSYQGVL